MASVFGYQIGFGHGGLRVHDLIKLVGKAADRCDVFLVDGLEKFTLARFRGRVGVGNVVEEVGRPFDVFGVG